MLNSGYIYSDRVLKRDEGVSVAAFYSLHFPHSSEEIWRRRIQTGEIFLNGKPPSPDDRLASGDGLAYHRPPWEEPAVPTNFQILYEDTNVLVLAKPSGLPVLPGGGFLENTLLHLARRQYGPGCSPLHRLGRGTSGAILFTRNARTARFLSLAMAERRIRKVYLALAAGTDIPDTFTVDAPIGPVPYRPLTTVHAYSPNGRPSISHVRVIRRLPRENAALLEVTIPTGRPHQIRIHLSKAGFPLVGDPLYQSGGIPRPDGLDNENATLPGDTGYFLHSWKIRFPLPDRGEDLEVVCPPPPILDPLLRLD
ncbi:MAG: pseudouridine synthase [Candidatus Aminicenantales bacterium]